jgi:hypothetical protein
MIKNTAPALMTALILGSVVIISAISLDYPGKIQMKLGIDGIQLQVDGGGRTP